MSPASVVVIGSGPAGIEAAVEAARLGATTTLIVAEGLGGNAVLHSLLPSKVIISLAAMQRQAREAGASPPPLPWSALAARVADEQALEVAAMEHRLAEAGVRQLPGQAQVQRGGTEPVVEVRHSGSVRSLRADFVIGATGSVAVLPPGAVPDGTRVLLPRHLPGDAPPPQPLALLGAGVAGTEFAKALAHLGLEVQLISPSRQILPAFSETAAKIVETALIDAGGRVLHGFRAAEVRVVRDGVTIVAEDGRSLEAASVLLNVGRTPLLDSLADLSAPQRSGPSARLALAGDALGGSVMSEGAARRSGGDAARRLLGGAGARWNPSAEGRVAFSLPPVAAFGPNPDAPTPGVRRRTLDQRASLSGRLSPESIRAATALVDGGGHLVGLEAIGECAVELLTAGQLLAAMGGGPAQLERAGLVTPSMADLLRQLFQDPPA